MVNGRILLLQDLALRGVIDDIGDRMTNRTLWLKAHLYVGLTIAVLLFIVALSGAALVFEDNIDRALNPTLAHVAVSDRWLPLQDLVARVRVAYPGAQLGSISFPEKPGQSMQISARTNQEPMSVYINQYTGQILGNRSVGIGRTTS